MIKMIRIIIEKVGVKCGSANKLTPTVICLRYVGK